eukprot:RCo017851
MNWFLRGGGGDAQELLEDHQKALKKLDDMDKVVVQQELNMKQLQLELQALRKKYQLESQDEDKLCGKLKLWLEELERVTRIKDALEAELATLRSNAQDEQRDGTRRLHGCEWENLLGDRSTPQGPLHEN